jgi:hypothetical protein
MVPEYLKALASDDVEAVQRLSWAGSPGSLNVLREDAFGSATPTEIKTVTVGDAMDDGALGNVGDGSGEVLNIPATVKFKDGRSVRVLVQAWIPPGKSPSMGPARLDQ